MRIRWVGNRSIQTRSQMNSLLSIIIPNKLITEEIELSLFKTLLVAFLLTIIYISKNTSSWMNCEYWNRNVEMKNDITTTIMNWIILSIIYHNIPLLFEYSTLISREMKSLKYTIVYIFITDRGWIFSHITK